MESLRVETGQAVFPKQMEKANANVEGGVRDRLTVQVFAEWIVTGPQGAHGPEGDRHVLPVVTVARKIQKDQAEPRLFSE